jgi:hypothetical protein
MKTVSQFVINQNRELADMALKHLDGSPDYQSHLNQFKREAILPVNIFYNVSEEMAHITECKFGVVYNSLVRRQ